MRCMRGYVALAHHPVKYCLVIVAKRLFSLWRLVSALSEPPPGVFPLLLWQADSANPRLVQADLHRLVAGHPYSRIVLPEERLRPRDIAGEQHSVALPYEAGNVLAHPLITLSSPAISTSGNSSDRSGVQVAASVGKRS